MEQITSRANEKIKNLSRLLNRRKARGEQGLFVTEGVKLTLDAFDAGLIPAEVYLTQALLERIPVLEKIIDRAENAAIISQELADKVADAQTPQGIFCLFPVLDNTADTVKIRNSGQYLLLDSLQDPGNVGAIIRTSEALGLDGLFLTSNCPDLYSPKVLRASMGGVFRLPIGLVDDPLTAIDRCRSRGLPVYGAALSQGALMLDTRLFTKGAVVVIGNEGSGLGERTAAACENLIKIPMAGSANSLNASVAAGILIWEMTQGSGAVD